MKSIKSYIQFKIVPSTLLLFVLIATPLWGEVDLIDANKSDSAIKMLVFPKSLRVIENRSSNIINKNLSDPKQIKKSLLKIDPARIVPAKIGETVTGPITRDSLQHLADKYSEDVILIFRRLLDNEKHSISHQGLIYLARQRKVLALREIKESGAGSLQEMDLAGLKILAKEARKVLHSHKYEKRQSAY
jgi:hypothetical protein